VINKLFTKNLSIEYQSKRDNSLPTIFSRKENWSERQQSRNYLTVQQEGNRHIQRSVAHYNLDVIISVGYRVKSQRGTQFRIWANCVLKDYLLKRYAVNQRIERIENKIVEHDQKFDLLIETTDILRALESESAEQKNKLPV
jgi:hypothetical protein